MTVPSDPGQRTPKRTSPKVPPALPSDSILFGKSEAMAHVRWQLQRIAASPVPVLLQGESGTGKDLIAHLIHGASPVRDGAFVKVNCPAIPATLLESELFGYEAGAFTGATTAKPGRVELAHHGTLFLDEIAEMDLPLQAKLLQFLQDGRFSRIGAQQDSMVEACIVCATNRHLPDEVECGNFRRDLLYRIGVVTLQIPSLRERMEDLDVLVEHFLQLYNQKFNAQAPSLSSKLMSTLRGYDWPGNIRELENLLQRYVVLGEEAVLSSALASAEPAFPWQHLPLDGSLPLKVVTRRAVKEIERKVILKVLQNHRWNRKKTAQTLAISYRALLYKIRDLGVPARGRAAHKQVTPVAAASELAVALGVVPGVTT